MDSSVISKSQKNKRIFLWDNLKAFLILSVVIGHFAERIIDFPEMKFIYTFIYSFHMPAFVFVSGLFAVSTFKKGLKLVLERCVGCLILSLLLKILIYAVNSNISISFSIERTSAWYLTALAVYYPVGYLIYRINKPYISIPISFLCGSLFGLINVGYEWNLSRCFVMLPLFLLGASLNHKALYNTLSSYKIKTASLLFIIAAFTLIFTNLEAMYSLKDLFRGCCSFEAMGYYQKGIILRFCNYVYAILFTAALISLSPNVNIPVFTNIGKHSLSIYFYHSVVIYGGIKANTFILFQEFLQENAANVLWQTIYILSAVVLSAFLSITLFETPLRFLIKPYNSALKLINKIKSLR